VRGTIGMIVGLSEKRVVLITDRKLVSLRVFGHLGAFALRGSLGGWIDMTSEDSFASDGCCCHLDRVTILLPKKFQWPLYTFRSINIVSNYRFLLFRLF
jgi:hypothetical protein